MNPELLLIAGSFAAGLVVGAVLGGAMYAGLLDWSRRPYPRKDL